MVADPVTLTDLLVENDLAMGLTGFIFCVWGGWNIYSAAEFGIVEGEDGDVYRARQPEWFWMNVAVHCMLVVAGPIMIIDALT